MEAAMIPGPITAEALAAEDAAWERESWDQWIATEGLNDDAPAERLDLDLWLDRRLSALGEIEREIRHQEKVFGAIIDGHRRKIAEIEDRLIDAIAPLQRRAAGLRDVLEMAARAYPFPKGKKSTTLPSGKIGSRASAETVKITDKAAALAFAREHMPDRIKVTEDIGVTPLKEFAQSAGIVPDGCEVVPASVRYYVETAGGEE